MGNEKTIENITVRTAYATLASQITSRNYGDFVNYSVMVGGTEYKEWQVFYKNSDDRIFIMSNMNVGNRALSGGTLYNIDGEIIDLFNPQVDYTVGYTLTSSYGNNKAASWMSSPSNWTSFVDNAFAEYAIGGPTLPMFVASWNEKIGEPILNCSRTGSWGYYIDTGINTPVNTTIEISSNLELYFKGVKYWFSSPSASGPGVDENTWNNGCYMVGLRENGILGNIGHYNGAHGQYATFPVVVLNSGILGYSSDGIWELVSAQ